MIVQGCLYMGSLFFSPFNNVFFTLPFFSTLETFFFHPQKSFFTHPVEPVFSPCTLPFSPCSMFLSPFTLFFSPFTLSFSPSTLSFQPSAGEAGNPWNLRRERCHLRLVSRRVCAAAKPVVVTSKTSWDEPFGTLRKLRRDYPERREPAETDPDAAGTRGSLCFSPFNKVFFHPPFFFHPRNLLFSPSKMFFCPPCGTFFFTLRKPVFFTLHPAIFTL